MAKCTCYSNDSEVSLLNYLFKCQLLKSGAMGIGAGEGSVPSTKTAAAAAAAHLHRLSTSHKLLLNPLT